MSEKRVALVIGNGDYQHAGLLLNPMNDADSIAETLAGLSFEVTKGVNLGRDAMENALFDFEASLKKADVALLFFAGHGLQVRGENYLLPSDANIEIEGHLRRRAFGLSEILQIMAARTETNLIFLDACRNNPFTRSLARTLGEELARDIRSGLAEVRAARGTFIAFATAPDKVALDGQGKNSPFTTALLKHMPTPGLSINDMMTDVIDEVVTLTKGKQEPWQQSSLRAKFYLKGASVTQPTPIIGRAELDWQHFKLAESEDLAMLKAYIASYEASEVLWATRARQRLQIVETLIRERIEKARIEAERKRREGEVSRYRAEGRIEVNASIVHNACGGWFLPGAGKTEWFKDLDTGPEMVVVPAGHFLMGSPREEQERFDNEGPRHQVTIPQPFAVGRFAIKRGQFAAFIAATGHKIEGGAYVWTGSEWKLDPTKSWRDPGFQQDDHHPVACVNWHDAEAYAAWLSQAAGKRYRLLSEAEWEYACRAGSGSPFWWGSSITPDQANYNGDLVYKGGGQKGEYRKRTVPVDSFTPNPWGLYQVHGNVWEWCEDAWHDNYEDKPESLKATGAAWATRDSSRRVLRGGSWGYIPRSLRAASRNGIDPTGRFDLVGFRLARTL